MVSLTCTASRTDGVTLVTGRLSSDHPCRVRVENCLDGPVWPPRDGGVPAEGWDEAGFETTLAAAETRPVGYATPAAPADEPMRIVETTAVDPDRTDAFGSRGDVPSVAAEPDAVVRELGDPRPPRDAVPLPDVPAETDCAAETANEHADGSTGGGETRTGTATDEATAHGRSETQQAATLADLFDGVEERIDIAERLSGETTLAAAAATVTEAEAFDGLGDVADQLAADADRLRRIERRAAALAERAETADVPTETVARLR
ncbi:DUF7857 domain-containing protein [Halorientalis litorea]|jgi:hypothetical protein|uniref:DUF7857 domain-containing protein n=1 Tax=Halorientalis litorea TaxID=2931977 RepID=UPI001FF55178|nr:hypothetical protein [Halorientalis litorea]